MIDVEMKKMRIYFDDIARWLLVTVLIIFICLGNPLATGLAVFLIFLRCEFGKV